MGITINPGQGLDKVASRPSGGVGVDLGLVWPLPFALPGFTGLLCAPPGNGIHQTLMFLRIARRYRRGVTLLADRREQQQVAVR